MGRMSSIRDVGVFATVMNRHCRDTNGTSKYFHLFERSAVYAIDILEIPVTNHKNVPFKKSLRVLSPSLSHQELTNLPFLRSYIANETYYRRHSHQLSVRSRWNLVNDGTTFMTGARNFWRNIGL